ncbi:hypothetical protein Tcan_09078 [Toxocara canis]|uniref:Uncharacterized protein n=1 Tax=Toxocara canis TaxID=6265 RepID=A0A0B2V9Z4_TOXCA|nr:hypothetical protein Tcan_09078 [Toxocara canis]
MKRKLYARKKLENVSIKHIIKDDKPVTPVTQFHMNTTNASQNVATVVAKEVMQSKKATNINVTSKRNPFTDHLSNTRRTSSNASAPFKICRSQRQVFIY